MTERDRKDLAVYSGTSLRPDPPEWGYGDGDEFLVHGIRHSEAFATSSEVVQVCSSSNLYSRARNARLIMSNTIPDMASQAVMPYCIWYPDVATEDTYREIVRRYPEMRYQVGRACAVAGYKTLFDELDLLPDVSIAEEARDNGHTDIFEAIVAQPVRYTVMNDYTRSVDLQNPRPGACLNGDAAVRSSLQPHATDEEVEAATDEEGSLHLYPDHYFDIQEDANAGPYKRPRPGCAVLKDGDIDLLHKPLPRDLPPLNKDILILMAAWDGNIDRYARLRRPITISNEITAVVRGAYHHTPYARWLETCVDDIFPRSYYNTLVRQAFHARFIMNDDLSRIDSEVDGETLPELFWWPHCPHKETLRELAWRRPDFQHQVTLACIAGNYRDLFIEISDGMKPTEQQLDAAIVSPNKFYREHLQQRAKEEGIQLSAFEISDRWCEQGWPSEEHWTKDYLRPNKEFYRSCYALRMPDELVNTPDHHDEDWQVEYYPPEDNLLNYHMHLQLGDWQRLISANDKTRQKAKAKGGFRLYSTDEDRKRREGPPPQPKFPKTSVIPGHESD